MAVNNSLQSPFLDSMRVLFSIMDDGQRGTIKLSDIERRWVGDSTGLPPGILECWRKVSLSGELTFELFCAGLKICLMKNESRKLLRDSSNELLPPAKPPRLHRDKLPDIEEPPPVIHKRRDKRRHTLQNGLDYNRLMRLNQLEQEKALITEALVTVTDTQAWLNEKLYSIKEQMRLVAGSSSYPVDGRSSIQHQERIELKRAELSRHLGRLANTWNHIDDNNHYLGELNLETQWSHQERMKRRIGENKSLLAIHNQAILGDQCHLF